MTEGRCGYGSNAMGNFIQGFFDKIGDLESWQPELLDQGLMELQSIPFGPHFQFPVPIIRFGQPVTQPMLLDGAGHEQKPDANGFRKPVYLNFRTRHYMPFNKIFTRGLGALGI